MPKSSPTPEPKRRSSKRKHKAQPFRQRTFDMGSALFPVDKALAVSDALDEEYTLATLRRPVRLRKA